MNDHAWPITIDQPVVTQRQPPASIDSEQALLGAILLNAEAFHQTAGTVEPAHFTEEIHKRIYDVMRGLVRESRPITIPNLLQFLGNHDVAEGFSTKAYLARLVAGVVTIVNAPDYARTVRDMAVRREMIAAAAKIADDAYDAKLSVAPDEIAAEGLGLLRTVVEQAPRQKTRFSFDDGMADTVDTIERVRNGEVTHLAHSTGYPDIDAVTSGGYSPQTLWVIAGRPGMGKSIWMTGSGLRAARAGIGVLEFSLELPRDEVQARHIADLIYDHRRPAEFTAIRTGRVDDFDYERILDAQRGFGKLPIVVECPPNLVTSAEIAARVHVERKRMAARGVTLGVVFVDYIDKIKAGSSYAGQRTYEIQEVMNDLKAIARAENVCMVVLAQLNRGLEGREDKRPSLADLKSSGALEQEAAVVGFIHREAYFLGRTPEFRGGDPEAQQKYDQVKHKVEVILGKNRQGPETLVNLWGDVACSTFQSGSRGGWL